MPKVVFRLRVQLDVPATSVEFRQLTSTNRARIDHRGDQNSAIHLQFSNGEFLRKGPVLLKAHPCWPRLRLHPSHQMIALTQRLTAAKVSDARPMLFEQRIHARRLECRDHEVVAVQGIGNSTSPTDN